MSVPGFHLTHLRFTLSPKETIRLPRLNKGITLRGAFGSSLRSLICVDRTASCDTCSLHPSCPYGFIFAPRVPEDAQRLRLNRDIPRPFVIKPPLEDRQLYEPGDRLCFDLVIVGRASQLLPYFLLSFRNLGERGIGANRGRFEILRVEALDAGGAIESVMTAGDPLVRVPEKDIGFADVPPALGRRVQVNFLTPVLLKKEGQWALPYFGTVMRRLRDRIHALCYFYCQESLEMDFNSFGERADKISGISWEDLRWVEEKRYSKHRNVEHTLKGWVGKVTYEGDLQEFWPFLWIGQYIHVGKAAVFGQGWYRVEAIDQGPSPTALEQQEIQQNPANGVLS